MISTTRDWKVALGCYQVPSRSPIVPANDMRIEYEQIDATAQNSASVSINSATSWSDHSEVMNLSLVYANEHPIATLELNEYSLGGDAIYSDNSAHCGWVSDSMSLANGTFTTNPKLTLTWASAQTVKIAGLSIWWSTILEEYAKEFKITAKRNGDITYTKSFTNEQVNGFYEGEISNYDTVEIEVTKWCLPYRHARIENVCMGFTVYITKSDILNATHELSTDLLTFTLPDDSFTFEIDNVSEEWNPDNPTGRYAYLLERQRVTVNYAFKINGEYEWHKVGTYFMSEWTTPQNGISASFTARSLIDFMTKRFSPSAISGYTFGDSITLKQLATKAFQQADLPLDADGSVKWEIDNSLADISVEIPWSSEGGYTRLDYIESHGTEWIDTGLFVNGDIGFTIKTVEAHTGDLFGGRNDPSTNGYSNVLMGRERDYGLANVGSAPQYVEFSVSSGVNVFTQYADGRFYINDVLVKTFNQETFTTSVPAILFGIVYNGSNVRLGNAKVSIAKIYQGSTLVRNFIPAKRDSDGEVGLLDIVSGEFYENQGTGTFTYGTEMGSIGKNPKWDFDYSCAEVVQLCANAGNCLIRPNEDGDICVIPEDLTVGDYYIDQFVSYSNGEYEISKALKTININDGELIYTPSESVGTGEEQSIKNVLLQNSTQRNSACAWMSNILLKRKSLNGEYRCDPRLQPLDVVTTVNKYAMNITYISNVKYKYNGAFRGTYEGKVLKTIPLVDRIGEFYAGTTYSNEYGGE